MRRREVRRSHIASDGAQADQPSPVDGAVSGRLLAGSGTASAESSAPAGVSGQNVAVIDLANGNTVASVTTGTDGSFRMSVLPGAYVVEAGGVRQFVRVDSGKEVRVR